MTRLRIVAYSDYLCPWCFNAAVRLDRLQEAMPDRLEIEWRSFLLRPEPQRRSLEEFRAYTRSWLRPAQDPDGGRFRVWATEAGPPSHSIPPHLLAKAAAELGAAAFRDVHHRLLTAYFADNRDVTDRDTLGAIWAEAGLPAAALARMDEPRVLERVRGEHQAAVELGISGVPAVHAAGQEAFIVGAQPYETYRRWIERLLATPRSGGS